MERESILTPRRVVLAIREIAGRGDLLAGASSPNRARVNVACVRRECRVQATL